MSSRQEYAKQEKQPDILQDSFSISKIDNDFSRSPNEPIYNHTKEAVRSRP